MKVLHSLRTLAALALLLPSLTVLADDLEPALRAALEENENAKTDLIVHDYRLFNHLFGVPPLEFEKQSKRFVITGKLTHHNDGGKSDRINYRIVKEKGAIIEIAVQINGGEFRPVSEPILAALGDYRLARIIHTPN